MSEFSNPFHGGEGFSRPDDANVPSGDAPAPPLPPQNPSAPEYVTARVPERLGRGVYSTGQLILDSPNEFVMDFFQHAARPFQVVARVVMAPPTMGEFAKALQQNLEMYTKTFGAPVQPPIVIPDRRPTLQEIYDNIKLPEELASGAYANSVLIGHGPTEFFFDFITGFFPNSAVSARVFIAAGFMPRFIGTVTGALQQYHQRFGVRPPGPTGEAP